MPNRFYKIFIFLFVFLPFFTQAAYEWEPGTALPAAPGGYELGDNLDSLIQYVYAWLLGAGGLFAFIRLIWAGIQWGGAGGNISKVQDAQATIKNVIQGLAILLFSWLLLNTVNPNIVNPDIRLPETGLVVSSDNQASPILARVSLTGSLFSKIFSNQKIIPIKGNEIQPFKWSNYAFRVVERKTRGIGSADCSEVTRDMTLKEAGFTCINLQDENACYDCDTVKFPKDLIKDLCEIKKLGANFDIWPGSNTGSAHKQQRAVDIVPRDPASWDIAMNVFSRKKSECGDSLNGPSRYGNQCYFKPYASFGSVWMNLDCRCGSVSSSYCPIDPTTGKTFFAANSHESHIHYSVSQSCSGRKENVSACNF